MPVVPFDPEKPPEDYAARSKWYSDNLERLAGPITPPAAKPAPEQAPKSISKASPTFQRQFAKWVDAIATGKTAIVD